MKYFFKFFGIKNGATNVAPLPSIYTSSTSSSFPSSNSFSLIIPKGCPHRRQRYSPSSQTA